ncbi:unnamed protein product [Caenorhabditis auriculariae]|uniref:Uncharacterized protein n=1 Tax=Caenorhabditis auriculariae TaxID=2777116 RepID=A0A8S1GRV8_9PELO|nr:unnamed protein product [Caenorhabditis auriculariae]
MTILVASLCAPDSAARLDCGGLSSVLPAFPSAIVRCHTVSSEVWHGDDHFEFLGQPTSKMGLGAVLLFALAAGVAECSEVFSSFPHDEPYYVREGTSGPVLPCSFKAPFSDRTQYEVNWAFYNNKNQLRIIARDERLLVKKDSLFAIVSDPEAGNYSLKIANVRRDAVEGTYHCNVIAKDDSGAQHSSPRATVVVLVPPGDPVIHESPDEPVIEGDTVTIKCVSIGGSPPPTFSWTMPNGSAAEEKYWTTSTRDGASESSFHFRVTALDNGSPVSCSVTNKATEDEPPKSTSSMRLNVLFKPRVQVSPVENMTHLSVEAGEPVNLTCKADANPSAHSYEWKHLSSGERYQASVWPMRADKEMSGDYECRATNQIGDGSEVLKLNVQYAPIIMVPNTISPSEKERVEVECVLDANPAASEVKWVGPDGFKSEGSTLVIKSISRDQTGNYTCLATNFLNVYGQTGSLTRVGSATTFIDVKRRPGKASIIAVSPNVNVGDVIELRCAAADSGNPKAQFKWSSPSSGGEFGTSEHDRATLFVRNAQLADNGEYKCVAYNELGNGPEAVVKVTVIEPAKVSSPLTTERIFSAGETKKSLECEAQGYPTPTINWYKDGVIVDRRRYKIASTVATSRCADNDFCTQTTYGALTFTGPLRWSDKGNFSCVAENGGISLMEDRGSWTIVRVLHAPVVLNERYPINSLAATELGRTAQLSCVVSARPQPEFHWTFKDGNIQENEKYSLHMVPIRNRPDEYEQVLQIQDVQEKDYGEYMCRSNNGNGADSVIIELRKTGLPETPDDLQNVEPMSNSILVGWRPKFDGGYMQTFVLEYRKVNPFTGSIEDSPIETVEIRNGTKIEEYREDGVPSFLTTYNLTSLSPMSTYYIRARAINERGVSEYTPMIIATTKDVTEDMNMMSPARLEYNSHKRIIEAEPRPPIDACTLLYVSIDGSWRASDCFTDSQPMENILSGSQYKARFCIARSPLTCSPISPILETGGSSTWRGAYLTPLLILAFIVLTLIVFCAVCCRTRSPSKKSVKMTPVTLSALPTPDTKNTIVHGSQTDSGVFTLDSTRLKGATLAQTSHTYSSDETTAENWPRDSHYDVSNDPYLNEASNHIFHAGVLEDQQIGETNVTGSEEEDGRRVMREIIV